MNITAIATHILIVLSITGCATGKTIKSQDDIRDDGKRNVVLLTHDVKIYATNKHSAAKRTTLSFRCPSSNSTLRRECFGVKLPYRGTKQVDGFGLHAFEESGAIAVKMKYDRYSLQSARYSIVTDRLPETDCYLNKLTKKNECRTTMKDVLTRHSTTFPSPVPINVEQGSGCYIGHLSMTIVDGKIQEYKLDTEMPLSEDKLRNMSSDIAAELIRTVNRPCM